MEAMIAKNEQYELEIEDLGADGEGIGRIRGIAIFVEGGVPGDHLEIRIVKVKKSYAFGKIIKVLSPSADRITPRCPHTGQCGGCQIAHFTYEAQLLYKQRKVEETIKRLGGIPNVPMQPIIPAEKPMFYRNKAQIPVGIANGKLTIGFFAKRSHRIVAMTACDLQSPVTEEVIRRTRDFLEEYHIPVYDEKAHTGLVRHIMIRMGEHTGEIMVCLVLTKERLPHAEAFVKSLREIEGMASILLNYNPQRTNVILGKKNDLLWGKETITDQIGGLSFAISVHSFFQVNPKQTEVLYKKVLQLAALTGREKVLDLYCGIGTISLYLAKHAKKVAGIEIVPEAIADAKKNQLANAIENAEFFLGAAEELAPKLYAEGFFAEVIVLDPPRKGCAPAVLDTILKMQPKRIVYVSCDCATLARDLKILTEGEFCVTVVQPVDMFPQTANIETVCLLKNRRMYEDGITERHKNESTEGWMK